MSAKAFFERQRLTRYETGIIASEIVNVSHYYRPRSRRMKAENYLPKIEAQTPKQQFAVLRTLEMKVRAKALAFD